MVMRCAIGKCCRKLPYKSERCVALVGVAGEEDPTSSGKQHKQPDGGGVVKFEGLGWFVSLKRLARL